MDLNKVQDENTVKMLLRDPKKTSSKIRISRKNMQEKSALLKLLNPVEKDGSVKKRAISNEQKQELAKKSEMFINMLE